MSLVFISYHNENVFDLENEGKTVEPQKFKYNSKFKDAIRKETFQQQTIETPNGKKLLTASGKYGHRTMGHVQTPLSEPSQFLRKHQGIKWLRIHDHVCPKESCLPPVPRRYLKENAASSSAQPKRRPNFIALNIENVKQMPIKRPLPRLVDTANGDRQNLLEAGLLPQYVHRRNFGKVPCYLQAHKQLVKKIRDTKETTKKMDDNNQYLNLFGVRKMEDEERKTLLEGLKANFMEQSRLFQRLSLFTDTLAKKIRKTRIENTLRQLEQDIYLMEKNPVIFVSNY